MNTMFGASTSHTVLVAAAHPTLVRDIVRQVGLDRRSSGQRQRLRDAIIA